MSLTAVRDWTDWGARPARPWSVRISEDVMIVEPDGGGLAGIGRDDLHALGRLVRAHATLHFGHAVVTLTTTRRDTVAEAAAEAALLRSELAEALMCRHDLAAVASGLHPTSDAADKRSPASPRSRKADPVCALRVDVAVPDSHAAVRALDGLRLHIPLLLALSANSPFWRGRDTGLASARTAMRAATGHAELTRSFFSYGEYVAVLDALLHARVIRRAAVVDWDARLRPDLGAVEVTVMDSQAQPSRVGPLAALVQSLVRLHAERDRDSGDVIPELVLHNRAAATEKGVRAELVDPSGHFVQRVIDELATVVDACAPAARELGCPRELAAVVHCATDPGYACQRSIVAARGLGGLLVEMVEAFAGAHPLGTMPAPTAAR
jgi:glutamate---cysteine ligase / carboxylate-amine ligase